MHMSWKQLKLDSKATEKVCERERGRGEREEIVFFVNVLYQKLLVKKDARSYL